MNAIQLVFCRSISAAATVAACAASALSPGFAAAAVVIDQEVTDGGSYQIQYALPSQTFTAVSDSLSTINVDVSNQYFGTLSDEDAQDTTLWMVLYQGDNLNDANFELGQSSADAASFLGSGPFSSGMLPFSFDGMSLTTGQTYTFQLFDFGSRYGVLYSHSDPYAGGAALLADGNPKYDLAFQVTSVPEPSAMALTICGALALVAWARTRRSRVRCQNNELRV